MSVTWGRRHLSNYRPLSLHLLRNWSDWHPVMYFSDNDVHHRAVRKLQLVSFSVCGRVCACIWSSCTKYMKKKFFFSSWRKIRKRDERESCCFRALFQFPQPISKLFSHENDQERKVCTQKTPISIMWRKTDKFKKVRKSWRCRLEAWSQLWGGVDESAVEQTTAERCCTRTLPVLKVSLHFSQQKVDEFQAS